MRNVFVPPFPHSKATSCHLIACAGEPFSIDARCATGTSKVIEPPFPISTVMDRHSLVAVPGTSNFLDEYSTFCSAARAEIGIKSAATAIATLLAGKSAGFLRRLLCALQQPLLHFRFLSFRHVSR